MKHLSKNNEELVRDYLACYKKAYVYGAGNEAKTVYSYLKTIDIEVDGFVVTEKTDNPENIDGKYVRAINELEKLKNKNSVFVIGVSKRYEKEVCETLAEYGYLNIVKLNEDNHNILKLEVTARIGCSIQCRYCPQQELYKAYFKDNKDRCRELSLTNFQKCIENMPGDTVISFSGFVEPFLHQDGVKMIQLAAGHGNHIELYTTFSGLSTDDFSLIKNIDFDIVVLHTPDENHYANIPVTSDYKRIIDEALSLKKKDGTNFIHSANCQSKPSKEFLEIAKGRINVTSDLIDRAGNIKEKNLRMSEFKKEAIKCTRTEDFNQWVLLPDGTVTLCCMDFGLRHPLGNLLNNDYDYIINDVPYRSVVENAKRAYNGNFLLCRNCVASRKL